ncbi:MAG: ABC transporter transmembrane domain-containing protein [Pseudomonadota bacterium]
MKNLDEQREQALADRQKTEHSQSMTDTLPLIKRLAGMYIVPHWRSLVLAMALMLISAGMTGSMAKLMEPVVDKVFTDKNSAMLWPVALGVFIVFNIRGLATYGQAVMINRLGQHVVSDINRDMFAHLVAADLAWFHGRQSGQLLSRFISDTAMMRTAVIESLTGAGKNTFTVIALICVMFYQDWQLSLASLFVFPAAAYFVGKLGRKLRKVSNTVQMETGELASMLNQSFQGNKHVKSYGMEEHEKARINKIIGNIFRLMNKSFRTSAVISPISETLSGLAIVTIIVYGGYQVIDGTSTPGKLFSFITAFLLAFEPMKRLAKLSNTLQMGLAAADRLFKMLDVPPAIRDKAGATVLDATVPVVFFDGVSFTYQDGCEALRDVSFEAPAGKTTALVGASGAGKSTILSLIPRFYDVTGGAIRIGGQDVRDVTLASLRRNMALVSQEIAIFNDTIRDNIAYGSLQATEEEIVSAAKLAAAHDFIMELTEGYDTRVGENGVKLSGGQRQRISIARAMLKNAPILLLDEATSALDAHSERLVQSALERLQKGRTTLVVAHRLSTIIGADVIHVLDGGRIVESGSHADLLEKNGAYARLYGTLLKETD